MLSGMVRQIISFWKNYLVRQFWVFLYFFLCLGIIALLKKLFLAQYSIDFYGLSVVLLGALISCKIVPLLEHVALEKRFLSFPRWVNVLYKTFIMSSAILVIYALVRFWSGTMEAGGLREGISLVYESRDMNRFLATILCVGLICLVWNLFSEINRHLGRGGLGDIFFSVEDRQDSDEK